MKLLWKVQQHVFFLRHSVYLLTTSSCHGHVDELATEPFLLLHREHGTGYRQSWNCCDRRTRFVVIWTHFCFILSTGTMTRIDSVMCPQSSSRRRNTSASVTVDCLVDCWVQMSGSTHSDDMQSTPNNSDACGSTVNTSQSWPDITHTCDITVTDSAKSTDSYSNTLACFQSVWEKIAALRSNCMLSFTVVTLWILY